MLTSARPVTNLPIRPGSPRRVRLIQTTTSPAAAPTVAASSQAPIHVVVDAGAHIAANAT